MFAGDELLLQIMSYVAAEEGYRGLPPFCLVN
jgi:hypothetical protein